MYLGWRTFRNQGFAPGGWPIFNNVKTLQRSRSNTIGTGLALAAGCAMSAQIKENICTCICTSSCLSLGQTRLLVWLPECNCFHFLMMNVGHVANAESIHFGLVAGANNFHDPFRCEPSFETLVAIAKSTHHHLLSFHTRACAQMLSVLNFSHLRDCLVRWARLGSP